MLAEVSVQHDGPDLRSHAGIRNELIAANAVGPNGSLFNADPVDRRGNHQGADMLVHGLFEPGDRTAIDFTVVSDRALCRQEAAAGPYAGTAAQRAATLEGAEEEKQKYAKTYASIGVETLGFAMKPSRNQPR